MTNRRTVLAGAAGLALGAPRTTAAATGEARVFLLGSRHDRTPVPADAQAVETEGYARPGDGGGALHRRVADAPGHAGWFRSSDGAVWELASDDVSIRMFGAIGDGRADDRSAIQAAVDFAAARGGGAVLIPPDRFRLTLAPAPDGAGLVGLTMRSGVRLRGTDRERSVLVLADRQRGPGTYGRIIASGVLTDAALADFTLDGNRAGQGGERDATNGGAILLGAGGAHVERVVVERLTVKGANGQAIQMVGHPRAISRDIAIRDNRVEGSSYIGVQVSHFSGLIVADNDVRDCRDNGIDVYGDDFLTNSTRVTSGRAAITGNRVTRCASGVFLETVADVEVSGNAFDDCRVTGLHINRIHGEPSGILITGNRTAGSPIGASMTGDFGGVAFLGNHFSGFTIAGLQFGLDGQGNVSNVVASGNVFDWRGATCPLVLGCAPKGVLAWIRVLDNYVFGRLRDDALFVNLYATNHDVQVGGFFGAQEALSPATRAANAGHRVLPEPPSHVGDAGSPGDIALGDGFLYVCVAPDRWRRTPLSDW